MNSLGSKLKNWVASNPCIVEGVFLSFIFFILFIRDLDIILPNVFNLRDYLRVKEILSGHLVWFGPELSRHGNIPGPFYYYFILIPYLIGGYKACAYFMVITISSSFGLIWINFKHPKFRSALLIVFLIFSINPILKNLRDMVWNPSYILIFWSFLMILLYSIYTTKKEDNKWYIFCLINALATQIHMSSLFWLIPGSIIYLLVIKNKKIWFKGILLFCLPFIPYFIWLFFSASKTQEYRLVNQTEDFSNYFIFMYKDPWARGSLSWILKSIYGSFGFLYLSIFFSVFCCRMFQAFSVKNIRLLKWDLIFLSVFFLVIVFVYPVFITRENPRYLLLPTLVGLCYIAFGISQFYKMKIETLFYLLFIIFFAINLFFLKIFYFSYCSLILLGLNLFFYFKVSKDKIFFTGVAFLILTMQGYSEVWHARIDKKIKLIPLHSLESISKLILSETSWSAEEFGLRVFWVGVLPEFTAHYVYQSLLDHTTSSITSFNDNGYIIVHKRAKNLLDMNQNLTVEPIWRKLIKESKMIITNRREIPPFIILNYKMIGNLLPISIQNTGLPNSISSNFLKNHQYLVQYRIPIFKENGPAFYLLTDKDKKEFLFFSEETSRFYTLGPNIVIHNARLSFYCDENLLSVELPLIGTSVGSAYADFYQGFSNPQSFMRSTLYTPIKYKFNQCQNIRPLEFKAQSISYVAWGKSYLIKNNIVYHF